MLGPEGSINLFEVCWSPKSGLRVKKVALEPKLEIWLGTDLNWIKWIGNGLGMDLEGWSILLWGSDLCLMNIWPKFWTLEIKIWHEKSENERIFSLIMVQNDLKMVEKDLETIQKGPLGYLEDQLFLFEYFWGRNDHFLSVWKSMKSEKRVRFSPQIALKRQKYCSKMVQNDLEMVQGCVPTYAEGIWGLKGRNMTIWDAFGASKKAKTGVFGQKTGRFSTKKHEIWLGKCLDRVGKCLGHARPILEQEFLPFQT